MKNRVVLLFLVVQVVFLTSACGLILEKNSAEKNSPEVAVESLSLEQKNMTIYVGESANLKATLLPENTTDIPVYTSSDEEIVKVDRHGNFEAVAEGEATITVSVGALKATCKVTAEYPPISEIAFMNGNESLEVGEQLTLEVKQIPSGSKPQEYVFSSEDERIATVDETGTVTAVGVGNTCICGALKENENIRCILELTTHCEKPTAIHFEENYYAVLPDGQETLSLTVEPFGMYVTELVWSSSDESVVTVEQDGTIVGHNRGLATITATAGELSAKCIVGVTKRLAPDPIGEISVGRYAENTEGILVRQDAQQSDTAKLMLIGDLMCLSSQQNTARSGGVYNFNSSFSIVKNIFAQSDFCIGNLETLVSYTNAYASEQKEVNGNPNCNGPATYLDAVKTAGLDALILANNHNADGGKVGVYETLQQLRKYKIPTTGLFANAEEQRYMIAEVNGIRIGIVSYTGHANGGGRTIDEESRNIMLNFYSQEKVQQDVADMKAAGAEFIIAYMHWGTENTHTINAKQKQQAQEVADAGVDLIAGSHPHCLQSAETLTATDGREVFCIYSLGNFVSSMGRTINNDTIILNATLKREGEKVVLADTGYIGCRVIGSYDGGNYVVVPNREGLNGGIRTSALDASAQRIAEVMGDSLREITEFE